MLNIAADKCRKLLVERLMNSVLCIDGAEQYIAAVI